MKTRDHDRLRDIQVEMSALLDEAKDLIRRESGIAWERAKGYWIAHIEMALSDSHTYLGSSMFTMESTINELDPESEDDEDCDE